MMILGQAGDWSDALYFLSGGSLGRGPAVTTRQHFHFQLGAFTHVYIQRKY